MVTAKQVLDAVSAIANETNGRRLELAKEAERCVLVPRIEWQMLKDEANALADELATLHAETDMDDLVREIVRACSLLAIIRRVEGGP